MASPFAIAAVGMTLLRQLEADCPRSEFSGTPSFRLLHPGDFVEPPLAEGLSVALVRVAINTSGRAQPPRRAADGRRMRPSLPVDLQFMVTPWAREPERQWRLLGWVMRYLEDHAILPAALLNQALTEREQPVFAPDEAAELFCDPLPVADYLGLWDKYKPRWQTSLTYGVRMVMLDSALPLAEGERVQVRELRHGQPAPQGSA